MTTYEIFENHCQDYSELTNSESKYEWAASEIFDLETYDESLDELFVKKIIEVAKIILSSSLTKWNSRYWSESQENYVNFVLACQIFHQFKWINWGTSIRTCRFDEINDKARPILSGNLEDYGVDEVPYTIENLTTLIDFIEH